MPSKTILPAIAITFLTSLAIGSAGFAQDAPPAHPANQTQGMMGGTNPSSQGPGMMGGTNNAYQNPPAPEKPPATETPRG